MADDKKKNQIVGSDRSIPTPKVVDKLVQLPEKTKIRVGVGPGWIIFIILIGAMVVVAGKFYGDRKIAERKPTVEAPISSPVSPTPSISTGVQAERWSGSEVIDLVTINEMRTVRISPENPNSPLFRNSPERVFSVMTGPANQRVFWKEVRNSLVVREGNAQPGQPDEYFEPKDDFYFYFPPGGEALNIRVRRVK